MFAQLDRIDIVADGADEALYIQTDHRPADEIAQDLHLSVLMAMARLLKARDHAAHECESDAFQVVYAALERPPEALCLAIAACGAVLHLDHEVQPLPEPARGVDELVDESMRFLADEVLREHGLEGDEAGLIALEKRHHAAGHDRAEDALSWWTAFLEIAAVAGEVVRNLGEDDGGSWVRDTQDMSAIPFVYDRGDGHRVNLCGRTERCLEDGWEHGPHVLLGWLREPAPAEGPTMLNLKPASWGSLDVACRPLLDAGDEAEVDIPIIAYGTDTPSAFAYKRAQDGDVVDLDALHAAALQTLSQVQPSVQTIEVEDVEVVVVSDDYYATEKLLDVAFMSSLHAALDAPVLAASVPAKGILLVSRALGDALPVFVAITRHHYEDGGGNALSPTVFLVSEGSVVGCARLRPVEEGEDVSDVESGAPDDRGEDVPVETVRTPWWKRLLGL